MTSRHPPASADARPPTPTRIRIIGRMLNRLIVRAPWTWPLVRGPMRRFFDRAAPGWDERTGAGSVDHLAPLAAALLHVKPAPERALEVGTGTGEGALLVAREFPQARVRGVDLSDEMIRSAKAKVGLDPEGRIAFRVADAAELPYEDESFDLVTHLNMPPFIPEVARVLRPGGQAIVASSWGAPRRSTRRTRSSTGGSRSGASSPSPPARPGTGRTGWAVSRSGVTRFRIPTGRTWSWSTRRREAAGRATSSPSSRERSAIADLAYRLVLTTSLEHGIEEARAAAPMARSPS